MAELEKVIKGLDCCRNTTTENLDSNPNACIECPYAENGNACSPWALFDDALELLKEYKRQDECPCNHCMEWECDEVCEEYKKWHDS